MSDVHVNPPTALSMLSSIDEDLSHIAGQGISTLHTISSTLNRILLVSERIADAPLVNLLRNAGITAPKTLEQRTAFNETGLTDVLSQGAIDPFTDLGNVDRRLADLNMDIPIPESQPDI